MCNLMCDSSAILKKDNIVIIFIKFWKICDNVITFKIFYLEFNYLFMSHQNYKTNS